MPKGPIRRAQLIAPFGVGAMVIVRDGTSLITCGLDHWHEKEDDGEGVPVDPSEFIFDEWRLQQQLRVDHFRLPPDYRENRWGGERVPNFRLHVPFLRFPQWHFCPDLRCKQLYDVPLTVRDRIKCEACLSKNRTRYLVQVPFVAMCEKGHIQDFPWREWVHSTISPTCTQPMRRIATGGSSLAAEKVKCKCGKERTLGSITEASKDSTFLTNRLDASGEKYWCRGRMPWLGSDIQEACEKPVRGTLRSASNVYYAHVKTAIYLPRGSRGVPDELLQDLRSRTIFGSISMLLRAGVEPSPNELKDTFPEILSPYSVQQIEAGLKILFSVDEKSDDGKVLSDDPETAFRREEYKVLRNARDENELLIRPNKLDEYGVIVRKYFSTINSINKLRETRALAGFSRIFPENDDGLESRKAMLRRRVLPPSQSWLPAYIVFGEGIFLEFDQSRLSEWETRPEVASRVANLDRRYRKQETKGTPVNVTPRLLLLHTVAHLLMNRLIFECGYGSASLCERLYVSNDNEAPMAGILLYTAAGDAEGTLGGLVRTARAGFLEPMLQRALESARWCSADPVCMEMGILGGQGPDSCNLAACHSCALVPETACEMFNRFLDRGVVVGNLSAAQLGYFN
ncbi:MAG TPA: DUF1998 domain-containing protein [Pyrinomonadaceae bacterium]|nr:DUF1998 domain-containing protein [Pyrinomonadaceae bacterium]